MDLVVFERRCRQCEDAADYGCRLRSLQRRRQLCQREKHECRKLERRQTAGGFCCDNGFLKEEYQFHSTTMLVIAGERYLAIEVRLLSTVVEAI